MTLLFLLLAIVFEVGWAVAMKVSHGFSRPAASLVTIVAYVLSLVFLTLATKKMEVSVAYALWAGTGAAVIAVIGMWWFREPVTAGRLISVGLIAAGIVGLRLGR
jgi:small multidrug resistance pump